MIRQAFEYLVDLGNKKVLNINEQNFSTGQLNLIEQPVVDPLQVQSLSGLIDYLKENFDVLDDVLIHVKSPETVVVLSCVNNDANRNTHLIAKAFVPSFSFDTYHDAETFNIKLQSVFLQNSDRDAMLQVVGNIREENVRNLGDDGISQSVTVKHGVATVSDVRVPNPVFVAPYRTFTEVDQPESNFVFRMREQGKCALFEADGGAWKLEAMDNIKDHLSHELKDLIENGSVHIIA